MPGSDTESAGAMDAAAQAKLCGMLLVSAGSLAAGIAPACLPAGGAGHGRRRPLVLSALLCYGAGALLGTALVHQLPELRRSAGDTARPEAELLVCAGLLVLYLADELVRWACAVTPLQQVRAAAPRQGCSSSDPLLPPPQLTREDDAPTVTHAGLLVALSLHAVLEGVAVGTENTPAKVCSKLYLTIHVNIRYVRYVLTSAQYC